MLILVVKYFQATKAILALAPWPAQVQIGFLQLLSHCPRSQGKYSLCCLKINTLTLKKLILVAKYFQATKAILDLAPWQLKYK
jgi:hypothetical protein